jgi:hypothetical protein
MYDRLVTFIDEGMSMIPVEAIDYSLLQTFAKGDP